MTAARLIGAAMLIGAAAPAPAQMSLGASVTSDYRLRGYSLSHGRPAASGRIGYDDTSGLFVEGTGILFLPHDEAPRWMGGIAVIGYARRLRSGIAVDAGMMRAQFSPSSSLGRSGGYSEVFAGASGRILSARLAYSWDYFRAGESTLYGSVAAVGRRGDWRVFGHLGSLARLGAQPDFPGAARVQYDWRAGVGRVLGPADLELAMTGGGPNRDYYHRVAHSKAAFVATARFAF